MITPEALTDAIVLEFFVDFIEPHDPLRRDCALAMSTDSTRRYPHETADAFWQRKHDRSEARARIASAINARKARKAGGK